MEFNSYNFLTQYFGEGETRVQAPYFFLIISLFNRYGTCYKVVAKVRQSCWLCSLQMPLEVICSSV